MNGLLIEFAAWLSDFYLLSTILLAAVLVVGKVVGQPARRIAIAWSAALGLVALAALCAAPDWSMVHVNRPVSLPAVAIESSNLSPVEIALPTLPTPTIEMPVLEEIPESVTPPITIVATRPVDWGKIVVLLMAAGSAVILLWLVAGAWQAGRLRQRAVPASAVLTAMLAELIPEGQTAPKLAVLAELPVAVAIGVRRPMILLPSVLADMSRPEKLRSVLAHELAHVEHRDLWLLALLRGLLVVLWAHPLVWLWRRQVRLDQETLADAAAAEVTSRCDYAEQLVAMACETASGGRRLSLASSVGLWENASQLKRRVAVLLDEKLTVLRNCSLKWRLCSAIVLTAVALGLSLVTLQPESIAVAEAPSEPVAVEAVDIGVTEKLNNGATVELLAIGTHGVENPKWWDARGRELDELPFEAKPSTNVSPVPNGQLVFRVHDLSEDGDVKWQTIPRTNTGEGTVVVDGKEDPPGYYHTSFVLPKRNARFTLKVGVAAGKWLTVNKNNGIGIGGSNRLGKTVVYSTLLNDVGSVVAVVSHNYLDVATRCIAIDKMGKKHLPTSRRGASAGEQNQTHWTFEGLLPEEVKTFAFQARPYEWAEFKELPSGLTAVLGATPKESHKTKTTVRLQVREVWTEESATTEKAALKEEDIVSVEWSPGPGRTETLLYQRDGEILFDESDVLEAEVLLKLGEKNRFDIQLKLSPAAGKRLALATKQLLGKRLAMLFDGKVIFAPTVRSQIGENVRIDVSFSKQEAEELARVLGWAKADEKPKVEVKENSDNTSGLSDEERLKVTRSLYKQSYDARKPNEFNGICVDENGRPLAGVLVEVCSWRFEGSKRRAEPIFTTRTDRRGEFRFVNIVDIAKDFPEGLPEEHFRSSNPKMLSLVGKTDGRVPGFGVASYFDIAKRGDSRVWVLQPAKTLRGRVVDDQERPVAGVSVSAAGHFGVARGTRGMLEATTDANGDYAITDLPAYSLADEQKRAGGEQDKSDVDSLEGPKFSIFVKHPNFAAKRITIQQIPGRVDVKLVPGCVVEGRITLSEGGAAIKPTAGSVVRLQRVLPQPEPGEKRSNYSYQVESTTIDESGHYRFESLPAGKYHLTADVEDWVTQGVENVEVALGETVSAPDILLTRGGRVRVQLIDDKTGEPMRFEEPTKGYINPQHRPQRASVFLFRDSLVEFSTEGVGEIQLAAGNYSFFVSVPSSENGDLTGVMPENPQDWPTYEVEESEVLEISTRLKVREPPSVDANWTVAAPNISPSDASDEKEPRPVQSDFIPATPVVEEAAQEEKGKAAQPDKKNPPMPENANAQRLEGSTPNTIRGQVVDEQARLLAGVKVSLYRIDQYFRRSEKLATTRADENAEYQFEKVADPSLYMEGEVSELLALRWQLLIVMELAGRESSVTPMNEMDVVRKGWAIRQKLRPAATLQGRVTDGEGNPIVDAVVSLHYGFSRLRNGNVQTTKTDGKGNYAINDARAMDMREMLRKIDQQSNVYRQEGKIPPAGKLAGVVDLLGRVYVEHPDFASQAVLYERIPNKIDIVMGPAAEITGRVVLSGSDKPAAGVLLQTISKVAADHYIQPLRERTPAQPQSVMTDEQGRYRFQSLRPGVYSIWFTHGRGSRIDPIEVKAGKTSEAFDLEIHADSLEPWK